MRGPNPVACKPSGVGDEIQKLLAAKEIDVQLSISSDSN